MWKRTRTLNQIHKILRRHNLEWERPTKSFQTRKVAEWLQTLQLGPMDRLALNQLSDALNRTRHGVETGWLDHKHAIGSRGPGKMVKSGFRGRSRTRPARWATLDPIDLPNVDRSRTGVWFLREFSNYCGP